AEGRGVKLFGTVGPAISAPMFIIKGRERSACLKLLPGWDIQKQGKGVYCCFNILWLMGYYPEVTYLDSQWENKFSLEEAVAYYSSALPIPGGPSKSQKEYIKSYLEQQNKQGLITEKVKGKFAWIWWEV
ncbi:MAG: methyltransferase family protein, partial [Peptococcaceae bacterium]|nr:methyltransferase family protein [Peptococcaceae bacterium]